MHIFYPVIYPLVSFNDIDHNINGKGMEEKHLMASGNTVNTYIELQCRGMALITNDEQNKKNGMVE